MADDYYKTLGVERNASQDDIQKAYRKLARKLHPDMNPDDPKAKDRFKKVQEAFDTLGDPEKRAGYDRYGADFERMRSGGWSPQSGGGAGFEGVDLESLFGGGEEPAFLIFFEQLVGGGRGEPGDAGNEDAKAGRYSGTIHFTEDRDYRWENRRLIATWRSRRTCQCVSSHGDRRWRQITTSWPRTAGSAWRGTRRPVAHHTG